MILIRKGTVERKIWEDNRSKKLLIVRKLRSLTIKNKKKLGKMIFNIPNEIKDSSIFVTRQRETFIVPEIFSIERNRKETLAFFRKILDYIDENPENLGRTTIYIDSANVKDVTESTLMYLFAVISDVKCSNYGIGGNHPKDESKKDIYVKFGFDKFLNMGKFTCINSENGNLILMRGQKVETTAAKQICYFIKEKIKINIPVRGLYAAFIELMTNTVQHAYDHEYLLEKKWQVFVRFNGGNIKLVFLDTGKGIPATVQKTYTEKILKKLGGFGYKESSLLESAFKGEFRSRTEEPSRGRGLPQIRELMRDESIEEATVYSGKSTGSFANNKNDIYVTHEDEIYGTLYEFVIKGV